MASTEVSSVVGNIIEAFQNSLTVFKKGRRRKHKRRSPDTAIDEDKLVQDSLSERPREIRRSYDHYVAKHGRRFEVGDSSSQTCLAQILLVLNTGLIKLLNYALSHDSKSRVQSRTNIFTLSESAAMETLGALSELSTRLSSTSRIDMRLPRGGNENIISSRHRRHAKSPLLESPEVGKLEQYTSSGFSSSSQQLKKPPMSPQLPHGGWIRSKSDPSVVTVVTPSKPTAKRSDRKKSGSSRGQMSAATESSLDLLTTSDVSPPPVYSRHATRTPPTPKPKPEHLQMNVQRTPPILEPIHERQLQHQPSMYIVPSDFINTLPTPTIPRYDVQRVEQFQHLFQPQSYNPHQNTTRFVNDRIQLQPHTPHQGTTRFVDERTRFQPRPTSMMTFMTASTKLGEIPDHKLPDRVLSEDQLSEIPMPYVIPDMLDEPIRKKKGFKFWKRQGMQEPVAA